MALVRKQTIPTKWLPAHLQPDLQSSTSTSQFFD
jgi:hypothetical protein